MEHSSCWGIFREVAHSPGRESDDTEILRLTGKQLEARGLQVILKTPDEVNGVDDVPPRFVFLMCERVEALGRLRALETRGVPHVNTPLAVLNTYRERMIEVFAEAKRSATRLAWSAIGYDSAASSTLRPRQNGANAVIHVPRSEHRAVFGEFRRVLVPGGVALLCLGAGDVAEDHDPESWLGAPMFWSHFDAETNLEMLRDFGFDVIRHELVDDPMDHGRHLFALVAAR